MEAKKIVHVHFKHTDTDFYFGSMLAIYDTFTSDDIGIKYDSLCIALSRKHGRYENKIVVINVGEIRRKKKTI